MKQRDPLILLRAARRDRDTLVLEGAHASVVKAADTAIQCYRDGEPVPAWAIDKLVGHARERQRVNRYGQ
jgi:hypothetical protein